jgi:predicted metallopeptidase
LGAIRYYPAPDIEKLFIGVITGLGLKYIDCSKVKFFRSRGSKSKYTIARIHGLPKIWQPALGISPHYILEVISEHYDPLSVEDKEKVIIHEALHLPYSFKGGLRHHKGYITEKKINKLHRIYKEHQAV